jgi:hypothetical protein
MPTFHRILFSARQATLRDLTPQLEAAFYAAYLGALERAISGVRPDDLDEAGARQLAERITIALRVYGMTSERITKDFIMRSINAARDAHRDALESIARELARQVSGSFDGVPREAFENLFIRRSMGLTDSYRSLSRPQIVQVRQAIEGGLERMVLDGESWKKAASRIVEGLVGGDPGMRAAARAFVNQSSGTQAWGTLFDGDPSEEAIKTARQIGYAARMIARTEVAHAYHEGDRVSSQKSPVVAAMKWNLSPRHPEPDICDVYAKHDFNGMGPGVYPPELLPPLPHPHDLCFMTHELRKPGEWRNPKPAPEPPVPVTTADVARYMPKGTDNAIIRTADQINRMIGIMTNQQQRAA